MFNESVMTSKHLILCHPLLSLHSVFPSVRVFSNESVFHIRWPKYWSFSFSISPSKEYSGLISHGIDCLISLQSKRLSRFFSNTIVQKVSIFQCSVFCMVQLSHLYMTTGKTIAFTIWTVVRKVMSLLFNMQSRLAKAFLSRSKHLLISWLQTPSAVILEPKTIKSLFQLFPYLFAMKWWDQIPWSSFFECWVLSQLFHSPLSLSSMPGASTRGPTHDKVMRRRPDKQGRSGLQRFWKAALALNLKMISVLLMLAILDYSLISVTQVDGLPRSLSKQNQLRTLINIYPRQWYPIILSRMKGVFQFRSLYWHSSLLGKCVLMHMTAHNTLIINSIKKLITQKALIGTDPFRRWGSPIREHKNIILKVVKDLEK